MQALMNFLVNGMKLERPATVLAYSLLCTAFTITVTVAALMVGIRTMAPDAPFMALIGSAVIGSGIAGTITFPVALILLSILHIQVRTIHDVRSLVRYDHLTGALNRAAFFSWMEQEMRRGGVFLMIDADHFKQLNDEYGHGAGDEALRQIASAITNTVGGRGEAGRLGGEEFGVFLPGLSLEGGEALAGKINRRVAQLDLPHLKGERLVTVSIGIAHTPVAVRSEDLMSLADSLLYEAKRRGRNGHVSIRTARFEDGPASVTSAPFLPATSAA